MVHSAVFGVSFATLAFEVLLARLFAFSQWHHLSFMVISIALFGFAASGSFLSLADRARSRRADRRPQPAQVAALSLACSAAILIAFMGLLRLPLDYFRLLLEPVQLLYLLGLYLLLILPFFFAGTVVALAYVGYPQHPGAVYCASMVGSALGALAPLALLAIIGEIAVVALSSLAPAAALLVGIPAYRRQAPSNRSFGGRAIAIVFGWVVVCGAGLWLLTPAAASRLAIRASEYKLLSQVLLFPETRVVESMAGVRGRIERVSSPHLRFAPGLSLRYTEPLPAAEAVFTDRDQPLFLFDRHSAEWAGFARSTLSFSGYEIVATPERVLLIMEAGGLAVACAHASGAPQVRILQRNPHLSDIIQRHYGIEVLRENPRALLARNAETFDLIHIESWGPSFSGADALHQDHLLTVEGLAECLRRLRPQGALIISRKLLLPPSAAVRLWATAREALVRSGAAAPERCLALLRNWDTFTLVATPVPMQRPQQILEYARRLNFDVVYLQGTTESDANRFNVFDQPYHFREIQRLEDALSGGRAEEFFDAYLLDVRPRSDLQPFPGRFLKWDRIGDLYRSIGGRLHALLLAGEVIVAVVFVQALVIAGLLIFLPIALTSKKIGGGCRSHVVYFLAIGAGFILAEMLFLHAGTFLLGDPVISLAVVLTVLLVASGAGGLWAQGRSPAWMRPALLAASAALMMVCVALWFFSRQLLALPEIWRYTLLAASMVIPGFAMGVPFPLGMRFLLRRPVDKTVAWAANGCASVLASIAAAQIAISGGLHYLLGAALLCYGLALWGTPKKEAQPLT